MLKYLPLLLLPSFLFSQSKRMEQIAMDLDELTDKPWVFIPSNNRIDIYSCLKCDELNLSAARLKNGKWSVDSSLLDSMSYRLTISNPPHQFGDTSRNWNPIRNKELIHLVLEFNQDSADLRCNSNRELSDLIWTNTLYKVSKEEFKDFRLVIPEQPYFDRFIPDSVDHYFQREPYWPTQQFNGKLFVNVDYSCFFCEDYITTGLTYMWQMNDNYFISDDKYTLFLQLMHYFGIEDYTYRLPKGGKLIIK